jgi:glycosidase
MPDQHDWWQTGVVYQIYPRSFKDSNGDGVGDLAGVIEKMDYLSETLAVDAIWLSPFYPSPMADFGYDVSDYIGIDPVFGDLPTFDRLVEKAHRTGLNVIIDFVPNHSSDRHAWFLESRSSRDNPKRDWYVWRDARSDGSPPNNWLSVFGGSAWEWDEATRQYYLHSFLKEQPDLNWRNPEVKQAMFDVVSFWLDRGVDGLRIDVAHAIMKDPELRDNPPRWEEGSLHHKPMGEYDRQLHLHDKGHPDVHAVYRDLRTLLDEYETPRMAVGEIHLYEWEPWVRYYGEALDELHMPYNFMLLNTPWTAEGVRSVVDDLEDVLPEDAWPNYVLGNHDEPRLATRYGPGQARIAAMLLLTLRGTPTLYYGDELGLQDVEIPAHKVQDPAGKDIPVLARDPCRTPMPWDSSPSAGFSTAAPEDLWLPVNYDRDTVSVEAQMDDPTSMLSLYRGLLRLRRREPALRVGSYRTVEDVPHEVFVYLRELGERRLLVALNFSERRRHVTLEGSGKLLLSTALDRSRESVTGGIVLRANEGLILEMD